MNTTSSHDLNPSLWDSNHRDYLLHYALGKVRNHSIAEDLVQETFLAAWKARDKFEGRASERTWLTRILLNKISDFYRTAARKPSLLTSQLDTESTSEETLDALNLANGDQRADTNPDAVAERAEFLELLESCLENIPDQSAQAFRMREIQGLSTEDIVSSLNITPNHLWVLIHRAKKALRKQLEVVWSNNEAPISGGAAAH